MSDGFFKLGEMIAGGGIDREGAYLEGLGEGALINQRRAQTDNALAQARQRQIQNEAMEQLGDSLEAAGLDRRLAPIMQAGAGSDFNSTMSGLETQQDMDFSALLANPNADNAARQGAGLALRGAPVTANDMLGPGGELAADIFSGEQAVSVTPTGQAQIGRDEAAGIEDLANAALLDAKRLNPEKFRSGGVTVNTGGGGLAEQILPGLEGTSIVPGDIVAEEGFGFEAMAKGGVNALGDFIGLGTAFPDTAQANNVLAELSARTQIAMRADVPGGRPPVMVQELLARYAEDPAQLFRGDELARQNLSTTVASLTRSRDRIADQLNSPTKKTPTRQGTLEQGLLNLSDTIADYEAILESLERTYGPMTKGGNLADDVMGGEDSGGEWKTTANGTRYRVKE